MMLVSVAIVLSLVVGFGLGYLWGEHRATLRGMTEQERQKHKVYRRHQLQGWVQKYGILLVGVVLLAQTLTFLLYYLLAANQHDALVCQVNHNKLTAEVLTRNSAAAKQSLESEMHLWVRFRNGIQTGDLTGPSSVRTIDRHIHDLRHRLRTIAANPYPPGGLCEQLLNGRRNT